MGEEDGPSPYMWIEDSFIKNKQDTQTWGKSCVEAQEGGYDQYHGSSFDMNCSLMFYNLRMFLWYSSSISDCISTTQAICRQLNAKEQHLLIFKMNLATPNNSTLISWLIVFFVFVNHFTMLSTSYRMLGALQIWMGAFECRRFFGQIEGWFMVGCFVDHICCWNYSSLRRVVKPKFCLRESSR